MQRRLRVLHVIPDLGLGGAERLAVTLARRQSDVPSTQASIVSLFPRADRLLEGEAERLGVMVHYLNKRPGFDLRIPAELRRLVRQLAPDVLHTHRYALRYCAPTILAVPKQTCVHTMHNVANRESLRLDRPAYRFLFQAGRVHVVGVSPSVSRSAEITYKPRNLSTVPNGIDSALFQPPSMRGETKTTGRDVALVFVGRLAAQKDLPTLLSAVEIVAAKLPVSLLIVGSGPEEEALQKCVSQSDVLRHRVHFLGSVQDVRPALASSDIFVMSSAWEGSPLALVEAMTMGLPVVATAVGGVPDLIRDGINGLLAPPADPARLAEAIVRVVRSPLLRHELGCAAAESVSNQRDVKDMARGYEKVYRAATGR